MANHLHRWSNPVRRDRPRQRCSPPRKSRTSCSSLQQSTECRGWTAAGVSMDCCSAAQQEMQEERPRSRTYQQFAAASRRGRSLARAQLQQHPDSTHACMCWKCARACGGDGCEARMISTDTVTLQHQRHDCVATTAFSGHASPWMSGTLSTSVGDGSTLSGSRLNTASSASVMSLQRCQTTPLLRRGTHSHFPTTALRAVIVSSALRVGLSRPLRFMGGSTGMAGHSPRPSDRRQHLSSGRQLASSKVSSPNAHVQCTCACTC